MSVRPGTHHYRTDHNRGSKQGHCGVPDKALVCSERDAKLIVAACKTWEVKNFGMAFRYDNAPLNAAAREKQAQQNEQ